MSAAIVWGIGQVFIKKGLSGVSPLLNNIFFACFAILVEVPFALLGGVNWSYFPGIFLFAFIANLPNYLFPYVIKKANVSLSGTVLATYPIFTIALSMLFLNESLDPVQLIGISGIILGMILVMNVRGQKFKLETWFTWAISGAALMGFGDFVGKVLITRYDLYSFILAYTLMNIPCVLVNRLFDKSSLKITGDRTVLLHSLVGSLLMPMGLLLLFIAFNNGPASLASPIASTYPAITVLLAYLYLKESINKSNAFGIGLVSLGVILVGI